VIVMEFGVVQALLEAATFCLLSPFGASAEFARASLMRPPSRCRSFASALAPRYGVIELPKCGFRAGDRVQIITGLLGGRRGKYAGETPPREGAPSVTRLRAPGAGRL
jgi:hypothetical protein